MKIYINYASGAATIRHVYSSVYSAIEVHVRYITCISTPNCYFPSNTARLRPYMSLACSCRTINSNTLPAQCSFVLLCFAKIDLQKLQDVKSSFVPRNFALVCRRVILGASTSTLCRASVYTNIIHIRVGSPEMCRPKLDACVNP